MPEIDMEMVARIMNKPARMCKSYGRLYFEWVRQQGKPGEGEAFRRLQAHCEVCGCRGIGGGWNPLKEDE